ncbi:hypothetical protein PZ895_18240 [Mesorhizobium sp. YIM 152430]|uniref:hypothetical protein n=1 Tax=Mesorhizobium sp. YIM 152430 TaxID=3031761 RepID=UPI0023DC6B97|nr:hypothetical protein [Mesorhizobium sp. YIM 152430]MDF1601701.1 hypothetical protein [Mesorhizobium sp. YIM 152430]
MTLIALDHIDARPLKLKSLLGAEPALTLLGLLLLTLLAPTIFAGLVDGRMTNDVTVWSKPVKFQVALAIYVLTLAVFARWLPAGTQHKRWYRIYIGAVIGAILLEMIWLMGAAANGVPAHFNKTPVGEAIYVSMGGLAVLLTSASAVYAWQIARNGQTGLPPVVKESIVVGLALVLPLTVITAGTMSSFDGHWVGGVRSDAAGLALFGWARDGGDLRVAHFFSTHAMHFLPVMGLASLAIFGRDERRPFRIATLLFVALVAFTFVQALSGQPFLGFLG